MLDVARAGKDEGREPGFGGGGGVKLLAAMWGKLCIRPFRLVDVCVYLINFTHSHTPSLRDPSVPGAISTPKRKDSKVGRRWNVPLSR